MAENSTREKNVVWLPTWVGDTKYSKDIEFECDYCRRTYTDLPEFIEHSLRAHNVRVGIQGQILKKKKWFKNKKIFWLDAWAKYPDRVEYYECSLCYERFMTFRGLADHCLLSHNVQVRIARGESEYIRISSRKSGLNRRPAIFQGGLPGLGKSK